MIPRDKSSPKIEPSGKLGVLFAGLGAVATTFYAGVVAVRRGMATPIGSLSQLQTIRVGSGADAQNPLIKDFVPLAGLKDLCFGAWDLHGENALEVARRSQVLEPGLIEQLGDELAQLQPWPAVFFPEYVRRLRGIVTKKSPNKRDLAESVQEDIRAFRRLNQCERVVVIWCGSTEAYRTCGSIHESTHQFEQALQESHADISPSMIYAWAALKEGCPYINCAPNLSVDTPALEQLSRDRGVPIAGKDLKTGQTLLKTILAPMLRMRMLGLTGWFSTNLLGNRDGEVLDDPESFRAKEESKRDVLSAMLPAELYPMLYRDFCHLVRINYYPPRGDAKEGWDNIDLFGWLGYPMQMKIDFLCRDSILAAPLVLDLILFADLAARAGLAGPQDWLSFYFKSPQPSRPDVPVENDAFIQHRVLKNMLRWIGGKTPLTYSDLVD
jgi:myo-inositol-1-phosphate synthase